MSASNDDKKTNSSRWWEFYFVRYFVGTVVGGAILLFLNASEMSPLRNLIIPGVTDVSKLDPQLSLLLAALGLAYCYVASAPILVLHATRGLLVAKLNKAYGWVFAGSIVLILLTAIGIYSILGEVAYKSALSTILLALVLSFQILQLCFSISTGGEPLHAYYSKLTRARSVDSEDARQYMESYKHLREHGNAFLILIFEMALGGILASSSKPSYALMILVAWITPAALVWLLGTILEFYFADQPPKL